MRCPTLSDLPPRPSGKAGWPWTEESPQLPDTMPDGRPWPRISIVTPSYNQGQFIEETIRSVLLQGYPDLEYIIIDGGSTDRSVEIIRKYEPWLAYWVSEPDRGQSHALNKGFERAQGEILAWLNSDDAYLPHAIETAVRFLINHPDITVVYGDVQVVDGHGRITELRRKAPEFKLSRLVLKNDIPQMATFFRRSALTQVGPVDESLHYAMDYDLWMRMALGGVPFAHMPVVMARRRRYGENKIDAHPSAAWAEQLKVLDKAFADPLLPSAILALQDEAYARLHLRSGLQHLLIGHTNQAKTAIARAFELNPTLTHQADKLLAATLYFAAQVPIPQSDAFVQAAFDMFPRNLQPYLSIARRRARILSAANHPTTVAHVIRDVAWTCLNDRRWLAHRWVLRSVLVALFGERTTQRLARLEGQFRHLIDRQSSQS